MLLGRAGEEKERKATKKYDKPRGKQIRCVTRGAHPGIAGAP